MDYLLALLIAFPNVPLPATLPPAVHDALVQFATRHDLSTPAESWKGYPFDKGVRWCAAILLELRDAPPSADAACFPGAAFCEYELARNAVYTNEVEAWGAFASWRGARAQAAQAEACRLWYIWQHAREARRGYSVAERRRNLARLKALLGDADYYAGVLCPGVPD